MEYLICFLLNFLDPVQHYIIMVVLYTLNQWYCIKYAEWLVLIFICKYIISNYIIVFQVRNNFISISDTYNGTSIDSSDSYPKIFTNIESKKFSFVMNGDLYFGTDPLSRASKMKIQWTC